jgi:poly(hydroxyalkanoate) depolymerase family esterase
VNAFPRPDLSKAASLTRAGKLKQALAALRGALGGALPAPPTAPPAELGLKHVPELVQELLGRLGAKPAQPRPAAPETENFAAHSFSNAAGTRRYKLFIPSNHRGQTLPLVVMLHGCTQSPDDFATGTRMNEIAETERFFVVYPEQAKLANFQKCWNWFNDSDQQRDAGEPSLIAGITRQVMAEHPVQPGHVYVAGLSAGAAVAVIMGATYPDLYAAVGVHSGLARGAAHNMASAFNAMQRGAPALPQATQDHVIVPTIVFHGDQDTTVNAVNAAQVIAQAKAAASLRATVSNGTEGGLNFTRTVQEDQRGRPMLEEWLIHGAGHAWSGGNNAGSFADPRGPDASREMLRFFRSQRPAGGS